MVAWKKLADSWTDEFMRLDHEADFWEKLQKQWDDVNGLVLFHVFSCSYRYSLEIMEM